MTRPTDPTPLTQPHNRRIRNIMGAGLVTIGMILFIEQSLHTGWLALTIIPGAGFLMLIAGIRLGRMNLVIPGSLMASTGAGLFYVFNGDAHYPIFTQIGVLLIAFGGGWGLIAAASSHICSRTAWWALVPGAAAGSIGLSLIHSPLNIFLTGYYLLTALGLAFLAWGVFARLFGLIIPGCLLASLGPGLYLSWGKSAEPTALAQTGVMLVTFALGWGLITLASRAITTKFVWWPLIPGGVLAMVGWGLYIGGNPGNAVNFLSNTGSLGLVIFGLYLLLWHKGFNK